MNKSFFPFLLSFLFLAGCATTKPLNTPSGKPDITIPNVSKKQVTDALVGQMLTQGFNFKSSSDYNIVFIEAMDSFCEKSLLGSGCNVTPEHRASFMLDESSAGVRIVLTNQVITNPGSAFERVTDLSTGKPGQSWQDFLVSFSSLFRGRIGVNVDNKGIITKVFDGSSAQQSGLKEGDKILSVDGNIYNAVSQFLGDPETNVEVIVLRNAEVITFNITRKILK
jgi:hypothetical protein